MTQSTQTNPLDGDLAKYQVSIYTTIGYVIIRFPAQNVYQVFSLNKRRYSAGHNVPQETHVVFA